MTRERLGSIALIAGILLGPLVLVAKYKWRPEGDSFQKVGTRVSIDYLIVQIDRLTPGDLHVYNPRVAPQPAVDETARLGIVVGLAFAAADRQPASAASLLTAQLPSTHGVLDFSSRLGEKPLTIADCLARFDYDSAGFSNLPLFSRCGLARGFKTTFEDATLSAADLGEHAAQWLEGGDPYSATDRFVFIHYSPRPGESPGDACEALMEHVNGGLKRARRLEGTLTVLTGGLDRPNGELQVPLIFRVPKRQPIGASRLGPCSLLDVVPTLLDLVGSLDAIKSPGRSLLRGQGGNNPLLGGFYFNDMALLERIVDLPGEPRPRIPVLALRGPQYEVGVGPKPADVFLFDRKKDSEGTVNLAKDGGADGARVKDFMLQRLFERKKAIPMPYPSTPVTEPLPTATRELLDSLGFP